MGLVYDVAAIVVVILPFIVGAVWPYSVAKLYALALAAVSGDSTDDAEPSESFVSGIRYSSIVFAVVWTVYLFLFV
jgi:hypothetical protein